MKYFQAGVAGERLWRNANGDTGASMSQFDKNLSNSIIKILCQQCHLYKVVLLTYGQGYVEYLMILYLFK